MHQKAITSFILQIINHLLCVRSCAGWCRVSEMQALKGRIIQLGEMTQKESKVRDFLGCPLVKNAPTNTGDTDSIPGPGSGGATKPWAITTEASCSRAHALKQEKPSQWEAHALHLESRPLSLQLEWVGWLSGSEPSTQGPCIVTKIHSSCRPH